MSRAEWMIQRAVNLALLAAFAGCAPNPADDPAAGAEARGIDTLIAADTPPAPAPARTAPPDEPPIDLAAGEWTAGRIARDHRVTGVATLREVRTARHEGADRIVFVFAGAELPSYAVEYVDRPVRECGSGHVVTLAGDAWLSIRMEPARAHDDEGRATISDRDRRPELPVVRQLRVTCDFEAVHEWVAGVATPNRFRVLELREPTRLVVDLLSS
jgi:hypothetical protein